MSQAPSEPTTTTTIDWSTITATVECPLCLYNLRGLTEPGCPECGERFALDELDADVRPRKRSRSSRERETVGVAAIAIPIGLGLLLLLGAGILAYVYWPAKKTESANAPSGGPPPQPGVRIGPQAQPQPLPQPQPPMAAALPRVGQAAKEIEGEDLDGQRFKLTDYRGKVVVLDFWGHW